MIKNEFSMLTKEEIDETVSEVLEEAGLTMKEMSKADADKVKAFQKKQGFKVGSAGAQTAAEEKEEEEKRNAQAQADANAEMAADHPDSDSGGSNAGTQTASDTSDPTPPGRNPAGGGSSNDEKTDVSALEPAKVGLDTMGSDDIESAARFSQQKGNIASPEVDPSSVRIDWDDKTWYEPGTSNLPMKTTAKVREDYPDPMGWHHAVDFYVRAGHGSDITAQMANKEKIMTIQRVEGYINKAKQSGDPADEMKVLRVLDSLLAMSIRLKRSRGKGSEDEDGGEKPPEPPPEPPPEETPEEGGDDKEFVKDQDKGPMTWMLAMHKQGDYAGASVKQVKGLAKAVESDLTLNERREEKELDNAVEYLAQFDEPGMEGAYNALKKLLTGFLQTTQYQLGPTTRSLLGFGGPKEKEKEKPEETPEETSEETPEEVPGEEEEEEETGTLRLNRKFNTLTVKTEKDGKMRVRDIISQYSETHKLLYGGKYDFQKDFAALVNLVVKVKKSSKDIEDLGEGKMVSQRKIALAMGNGTKLLIPLFDKLSKQPEKNPAGRAFKAMRQFKGKVRIAHTVGFFSLLWQNITGKKISDSGDSDGGHGGGEVIKMPTGGGEKVVNTPEPSQSQVAAESIDKNSDNLLLESTVKRWKTISGVSRGNKD